jgi:KDO2-lipid IV(A) lauroyltransferase
MKGIKKRVRRWFAYFGIKTILSALKIVPKNLWLSATGVLAFILKILFSKQTKIIKENYKRVYGKEPSNGFVNEFYRNLIYGSLEVVYAEKNFPDGFEFLVDEGKLKIIDELIKNGKKVVWVSGHIGNWELLPFYFSLKGYKISVLARRLYDDRLNERLEKFRKKMGVNVIYREEEKTGFQLVRALKRDDIIGFLVDQNIKNVESIESSFLGIPSRTPSGFARIAMDFLLPVIVGVNIRVKPFRFKILISDPIFPEGKTEKEMVDDVNSILTDFIKLSPEQWMWMHRRWG